MITIKRLLIKTILLFSFHFFGSDKSSTPKTIAKKYYPDIECPSTNPTKADSQGIVTQKREKSLRIQAEEQQRILYNRYGTPPRLPF
jgi:hypothetical protein